MTNAFVCKHDTVPGTLPDIIKNTGISRITSVFGLNTDITVSSQTNSHSDAVLDTKIYLLRDNYIQNWSDE